MHTHNVLNSDDFFMNTSCLSLSVIIENIKLIDNNTLIRDTYDPSIEFLKIKVSYQKFLTLLIQKHKYTHFFD